MVLFSRPERARWFLARLLGDDGKEFYSRSAFFVQWLLILLLHIDYVCMASQGAINTISYLQRLLRRKSLCTYDTKQRKQENEVVTPRRTASYMVMVG